MDLSFLPVMVSWLQGNYIELLATLTGFIYLILSIREKIGLWFFGLCSSALFMFVFYRARIYADMGINAYYVLISIYGWYHWYFDRERNQQQLPVTRITSRMVILLLTLSGLFYGIIFYILSNYTNSDIAGWDAFTTAFSITATWMLARKILEHWLVWIVVDLVSVGLYLYKGLYPTVGLFSAYTILAAVGYRQWKS